MVQEILFVEEKNEPCCFGRHWGDDAHAHTHTHTHTYKVKVKVKVLPMTGHEGPEGE